MNASRLLHHQNGNNIIHRPESNLLSCTTQSRRYWLLLTFYSLNYKQTKCNGNVSTRKQAIMLPLVLTNEVAAWRFFCCCCGCCCWQAHLYVMILRTPIMAKMENISIVFEYFILECSRITTATTKKCRCHTIRFPIRIAARLAKQTPFTLRPYAAICLYVCMYAFLLPRINYSEFNIENSTISEKFCTNSLEIFPWNIEIYHADGNFIKRRGHNMRSTSKRE